MLIIQSNTINIHPSLSCKTSFTGRQNIFKSIACSIADRFERYSKGLNANYEYISKQNDEYLRKLLDIIEKNRRANPELSGKISVKNGRDTFSINLNEYNNIHIINITGNKKDTINFGIMHNVDDDDFVTVLTGDYYWGTAFKSDTHNKYLSKWLPKLIKQEEKLYKKINRTQMSSAG